MSKAALFLDRDGVINVDKGYVYKPEDCEFVDGIFELVARAHGIGMLVIVVTNQAGIARGYYTEDEYHTFTSWMKEQFTARGTPLTAVYHCPHHPTAGVGDYLRECICRKPSPGMLLAARDTFDLDMARSVMVGDMPTDMQAALKAGVGTRWKLEHTPTRETATKTVTINNSEAWRIVNSIKQVTL